MIPGGIGSLEMVLIGIVAVMLFGGRLPQVARSLGQTYGQFRKGLDELKSNFDQEMDVEIDNDVPKLTHQSEDEPVDEDEDVPSTPQFVPPSDDE